MNPIILYTKRLEIKFDDRGTSVIPLAEITKEILTEYVLLDPNPAVTLQGNYQFVTFKVTKKKEEKSLGFSFGKKE